jgi:hypothetical protein
VSGPGGGGYLAPWKFIKDPTITDEVGMHIEDRMSKEAAKYIQAHKDQPFYLNYWAYSVHSPWNARADYIEHFKAKADPKNPQHNALYAAMVKSLDDGVGRILQAIDDAGIADNTIIVFYSDNGGYAYPPGRTDPEGYSDIPATSNLPLRSGKASLYEGGTREPFIFAWPGKAKAPATSDILFQSVDFYPTLLSCVGLKPHADLKLDGLDQSQALLGGDSARDRTLLEGRAATLAAAIDAVVVLKGPGTFVVGRAGLAHNETGNPGMATAGTGDVLTGIVAALLAQGLAPFDAARLAAWLHGRAGELAADRVGEISLIATDLLGQLPQAITAVLQASGE